MAADLIQNPTSRKLRIFAFDPSVSSQFDTAGIGELTISIPWEANLQPGPVGEYIEVVDVDPASGAFYAPVDLNDQKILGQDGLEPSEPNPQFHQQMVYAVAMATIGHFEEALGRVAQWSTHRQGTEWKFVRRLRIYPHALRDRNAFYSPVKKALLFGYFPVSIKNAANTPGTLVFTCLSHDIIAHETAHALLDGVHPRFNEPINHDVLAFHEAFADIVALFQHFAYPGVLRDQITRTRGNLAGENLLGQLAQQFGAASGRGNALRDALGAVDPATGKWTAHKPDVHILDKTHEPHDRGAILVAAVFSAFIKVYKARTADLYRIATEGTGILREGEIHPDLSNRLADEAARCASYVLQACIRAIDYCPPVGITFGDYLRAIVTADFDLNPEDTNRYQLAFIESFRQWGISPKGMRSMSVESLVWPTGDEAMEESGTVMDDRDMKSLGSSPQQLIHKSDRARSKRLTRLQFKQYGLQAWGLAANRYEIWEEGERNSAALWAWLIDGPGQKLAPAIGIVLDGGAKGKASIYRSRRTGGFAVEVQVRTAVRRKAHGAPISDLVVEITQRRRGYYDANKQRQVDTGKIQLKDNDHGDFRYRAGCTLLIDSQSMEVRRVIRTPGTIDDDDQLERVRGFLTGELEPTNAFEKARAAMVAREPFALLHHDGEG